MARLLKTYPSMSKEYVSWELPMMQGWAFYNWGVENDGWLQFSGIKRSSPGYVKQQVESLVSEAVKYLKGHPNGS